MRLGDLDKSFSLTRSLFLCIGNTIVTVFVDHNLFGLLHTTYSLLGYLSLLTQNISISTCSLASKYHHLQNFPHFSPHNQNMTGSPFDFIYEDSDDSIHLPLRGQKRRFDLDVLDMVPLMTLSQPNMIPRVSDHASSLPLKERKKATMGTQPKPKRRHESTDLDIDSPSQRRSYKRSRTGPVPDVVVRQLHLDKADLLPVLDKFEGLQCVLPGSGDMLTLDKKSLGPLRCDVPVLMFFFDFANVSWLKFFELFREKNIKIIAVTPQYNYFNPQSFPIVLDKNGVVTKLMGIQSPVGGGIFPIPSIFMFDRYQKEVMRIMLGYDFNVYYGSNASNSLQKVLADTVDYTLGI